MEDRKELVERMRAEPMDRRKAAMSIMDLCIDAAEEIETLRGLLSQSEAARADLGKRLAAAQQELSYYKELERDGKLVLLPFKPHSTMLDSTDVANLMLMKDVRLAVAWTSSSGVLFYTQMNHFLRDMQEGKICLLEERHCDKCDYWTENDPRCMCSESQWAGRKVKANNYCRYFARRKEKMTNADRIRPMSDEELVVFLDGFSGNCLDCTEDAKNKSCPIYKEGNFCRPKDIMEWIQKPAEEKTE